jgi:hypothetical protein
MRTPKSTEQFKAAGQQGKVRHLSQTDLPGASGTAATPAQTTGCGRVPSAPLMRPRNHKSTPYRILLKTSLNRQLIRRTGRTAVVVWFQEGEDAAIRIQPQ